MPEARMAWPTVCLANWSDYLPERNFRFLVWTLLLVGGLLICALVLALAKRWRDRMLADVPTLSANDQLTHFRSLYERGEISSEEFDRIRGRLGEQIKKDLLAPKTEPDKPATAEGEKSI